MKKLIPFRSTGALMLFLLAGCTVGPDYDAPSKPDIKQFIRQSSGDINTGPAVAKWWLALNDPHLNALLETALANNPDIAIAEARLRQSRASLTGEYASALPEASVTSGAVRTRLPESPGLNNDNPLNLYTGAFEASWEVDLFGGTRRAIESAEAQAQASAASLADAHVSIIAEVTRNYLVLCGQRQQLALLQQNVNIQQRILTLTEQRRERGVVSDSDVTRLRNQLENTQAQIPSEAADISDSLDTLAYLLGKTPGELDRQLAKVQQLPALPSQITVGDPATLLRQRPDVRIAERQLAASSAQIGEHVADYFPKVNLFGTLGFSSTGNSAILQRQNMSWTLVPYLQWHFLDFGRVKAQVNNAKAARDEAEVQWHKTVLNALRDTNSALSRYGHQRENLLSLQRASLAAEKASGLMRQRYLAGTASLIDELDTERSLLLARQQQVQAQTQLTIDYVALQKSLGSGWQS